MHEPDLELCECCRLSIANTFFNEPAHRQVTCYSVKTNLASELVPNNCCQIDCLLISHDWLQHVLQLFLRVDLPLVSHHFPLVAKLNIHVPKHPPVLFRKSTANEFPLYRKRKMRRHSLRHLMLTCKNNVSHVVITNHSPCSAST